MIENKILVVVDMQKDFIDGSLGTKEAVSIVPNVVSKIKQYRREHQDVIYTLDTHYADYLETLEGSNLPVPHCIRYTDGHRICKEIGNLEYFDYQDDGILVDSPTVYYKNTFGCINLCADIASNIRYGGKAQITSVEFVGLCTDICVISNALMLRAYCPDLDIVVDASCCAGVTPDSHKNALEAMKMCQIRVINEEN